MKMITIHTPRLINLIFGILGLTIVWINTHNWMAMFGAVITGIHFTIKVRIKKKLS